MKLYGREVVVLRIFAYSIGLYPVTRFCFGDGLYPPYTYTQSKPFRMLIYATTQKGYIVQLLGFKNISRVKERMEKYEN